MLFTPSSPLLACFHAFFHYFPHHCFFIISHTLSHFDDATIFVTAALYQVRKASSPLAAFFRAASSMLLCSARGYAAAYACDDIATLRPLRLLPLFCRRRATPRSYASLLPLTPFDAATTLLPFAAACRSISFDDAAEHFLMRRLYFCFISLPLRLFYFAFAIYDGADYAAIAAISASPFFCACLLLIFAALYQKAFCFYISLFFS